MEAREGEPAVMLGDKGYDGDPIRQDPYDRGVIPAIPARRNRHVQRSVGRPRCAPHNRIERFIARPKISRRSATRYEPKATPEVNRPGFAGGFNS